MLGDLNEFDWTPVNNKYKITPIQIVVMRSIARSGTAIMFDVDLL